MIISNSANYGNYNVGFGIDYGGLVKQLKYKGCELDHHGKGSHDIFVRTAPDGRVYTSPIPNHGHKDIPKGTVAAIMRQLGIK